MLGELWKPAVHAQSWKIFEAEEQKWPALCQKAATGVQVLLRMQMDGDGMQVGQTYNLWIALCRVFTIGREGFRILFASRRQNEVTAYVFASAPRDHEACTYTRCSKAH